MKKLILFLILFSFQISYSQWEACNNGLWGAAVTALAIDGNYIILGTWEDGIYISSDKGNNWIQKNNGLTNYNINCITINNDIIYIGNNNGLYISSDYGNNWDPIYNRGVGSIFIDGNKIFIWSGGVLVTIDNGVNWKSLFFNNYGVYTFAKINNNLFIGNGLGLYISSDDGLSWKKKKVAGRDTLSIKSILFYNNYFYLLESSSFYISSDYGNNWYSINNSGLPNNGNRTMMAYNNCIIVGTVGNGIYITSDNGKTWLPFNNGLSNLGIYALAICDSNLIAGSSGGLFLSTNQGINWYESNKGLTNTYIYSMIQKESNLYVSSQFRGVYLSSDYGNTWVQRNNGLTNLAVGPLALKNNDIFVGSSNGNVFKSSDNGNNWIEKDSGINNPYIVSFCVKDNDIFIGAGNGVFVSENNGDMWIPKNNGLRGSGTYSFVIKDNNIFAATHDGVFLSTDIGNSWTQKDSGFITHYVRAIAKNDDFLFAGNGVDVFRSSDNGNFWIRKNSNYTIWSLTTFNNNIFVGTDLGGVFISTNNGESWSQKNAGLNYLYIQSLNIIDNFIYACTLGGGVYRAKLSEITDVKESVTIRNNYFSIFPNPVQHILNIDVGVRHAEPLQLQMYDIFGKQVAESQIPAGESTCNINLEGLPEGMYIIKINDKFEKILKY